MLGVLVFGVRFTLRVKGLPSVRWEQTVISGELCLDMVACTG